MSSSEGIENDTARQRVCFAIAVYARSGKDSLRGNVTTCTPRPKFEIVSFRSGRAPHAQAHRLLRPIGLQKRLSQNSFGFRLNPCHADVAFISHEEANSLRLELFQRWWNFLNRLMTIMAPGVKLCGLAEQFHVGLVSLVDQVFEGASISRA